MPIESKLQNLTYFAINDKTGTPINKVEIADFDFDFDSEKPYLDFAETITLEIEPQTATKILSVIMGVPLRVIHLMKNGKTRRVRKKNRKRLYS